MGAIVTVIVLLIFVMVGFLLLAPGTENDISKQLTGITIPSIISSSTIGIGPNTSESTTCFDCKMNVVKRIPITSGELCPVFQCDDGSTMTTMAASMGTIDQFCGGLFPEGYHLPRTNDEADSGCFPVANLDFDLTQCRFLTLLNGEKHRYCFSNGEFLIDGLQGTGISFVQNWCDMGDSWAICGSNVVPPILSFLTIFP